MSPRVDPSVAQLFAQTVGAKPLQPGSSPAAAPAVPRAQPGASRSAPSRLDPTLVQKVADNVPMFSHMPADQVQAVLARGVLQRHAAGTPIWSQGDLGRTCHVVLRGQVQVQRVQNGSAQLLATLGLGACFGEMALVRDEVRSASVVAVGDCVTLCLDRAAIDAQGAGAASIYRNIAAILAERLQALNPQHASDVVLSKEPHAP